MPTSWPIAPPWSREQPRSRSGPIFCIGLFAWLFLSQLWNLAQWDSFMGLPAWTRILWAVFDVLVLLGFVGSYQRVIHERREIRQKRFMETDWPELEPATDWQEIDRAMGELIAKGIDPTYERAKNWLRHEAAEARTPEEKILDSFRVPPMMMGEHPYGTTPLGLIDEVRVEMERDYRENHGGWMPSCVQRLKDAEVVARKRWPQHFD